jgi:hypothetical protein
MIKSYNYCSLDLISTLPLKHFEGIQLLSPTRRFLSKLQTKNFVFMVQLSNLP